MLDLVTEPLGFAFMQRALLASGLAAIVCAVVGTFVRVQRSESKAPQSETGQLQHLAAGDGQLGSVESFTGKRL